MNSTLLTKPIYNSTASLSSRVTDIANVFVLPPICVFGIVLNIFCIIVVSRKELSGELYTFILFHSICDLIFLVINVFTCIVRCGIYCAYGYAFLSKVWELYIHLFTGNSFLLFGTGLDIVVAFNRLFSFSSTQPKLIDRFNKIDLKIKCLVLAILSALANTPSYIITRNVQLIGYLESSYYDSGDNSTDVSFQPLYQALTNALGKSEPMIVFLFVLTLFRGVIPLFALFFINLVIAYRFKMHVKKKRKIVPIAHTTTNSNFYIRIFRNFNLTFKSSTIIFKRVLGQVNKRPIGRWKRKPSQNRMLPKWCL